MFSKTRPTESLPQPTEDPELSAPLAPPAEFKSPASALPAAGARKSKPSASVLSSDITVTGNIHSSGDIQIEGCVEGDVRAQTLIVGETATVKGEIVADEIIVHGRVSGRLRGVKVRLTASARADGDIVHKSIAIESGAQFEGSVQRHDDPVGQAPQKPQGSSLASVPAPAPAKAAG
jgi:cytoskeletal protein CcmA (bactofilin family)